MTVPELTSPMVVLGKDSFQNTPLNHLDYGSDSLDPAPVSYTHLTLPTNREV